MNSFFPDINVLLALTVMPHPAYDAARAWWNKEAPSDLVLCRISQIGYLRLLTQRSALNAETRTNHEAWLFYDQLMDLQFLRLVDEPASLAHSFRERSALRSASPSRWNDAYFSAFASAAGLRLVTFDKALARYTPRSILLRS